MYKSFELTKGKVWKLIFLALPFLLILGFFQGVINSFEESLTKNRSFEYLTSIQSQAGTGFTNDYEFLSNFYSDSLSDEDNINILRLQARFEEKKDGIRAEYFDAVYPYLDTSKTDPNRTSSSLLFFILSFFLLE